MPYVPVSGGSGVSYTLPAQAAEYVRVCSLHLLLPFIEPRTFSDMKPLSPRCLCSSGPSRTPVTVMIIMHLPSPSGALWGYPIYYLSDMLSSEILIAASLHLLLHLHSRFPAGAPIEVF